MAKFKLEKHIYAPELTKIHFLKGGTINCLKNRNLTGCQTIKEVRLKLFKIKDNMHLKNRVVIFYYYKGLEHKQRKLFNSLREASKWLKKEQGREVDIICDFQKDNTPIFKKVRQKITIISVKSANLMRLKL